MKETRPAISASRSSRPGRLRGSWRHAQMTARIKLRERTRAAGASNGSRMPRMARTWAYTRARDKSRARGYYQVMTRFLPGKTWDQEVYLHPESTTKRRSLGDPSRTPTGTAAMAPLGGSSGVDHALGSIQRRTSQERGRTKDNPPRGEWRGRFRRSLARAFAR